MILFLVKQFADNHWNCLNHYEQYNCYKNWRSIFRLRLESHHCSHIQFQGIQKSKPYKSIVKKLILQLLLSFLTSRYADGDEDHYDYHGKDDTSKNEGHSQIWGNLFRADSVETNFLSRFIGASIGLYSKCWSNSVAELQIIDVLTEENSLNLFEKSRSTIRVTNLPHPHKDDELDSVD